MTSRRVVREASCEWSEYEQGLDEPLILPPFNAAGRAKQSARGERATIVLLALLRVHCVPKKNERNFTSPDDDERRWVYVPPQKYVLAGPHK